LLLVALFGHRSALNSLVDLYDALPGTGAQRHADCKTKKHGGNQTKRERPTDDACDLPDFVDISSDDQHVAARQTSRDQANRLFLPTAFVYPVDHSAPCRVIGLQIGWQPFQVTCGRLSQTIP
jgi:hypothetical protein